MEVCDNDTVAGIRNTFVPRYDVIAVLIRQRARNVNTVLVAVTSIIAYNAVIHIRKADPVLSVVVARILRYRNIIRT